MVHIHDGKSFFQQDSDCRFQCAHLLRGTCGYRCLEIWYTDDDGHPLPDVYENQRRSLLCDYACHMQSLGNLLCLLFRIKQSSCTLEVIWINYYISSEIKDELLAPLFIYCFFGILIGARLGHCIFYQPQDFLTSGKGIIEMLLPIRFIHKRNRPFCVQDEQTGEGERSTAQGCGWVKRADWKATHRYAEVEGQSHKGNEQS